MFTNRTLGRLEQMLDDAMDGTFLEADYDETRLSRLEAKWKHFLGASALSRENLEKEKENVKGLVSDISHQTKTPMTNIKLYASLLRERLEQEGGEDTLLLAEELCRQADKLEFLIQSLTKLSRLESNTVSVSPRRQSVAPLLERVVRQVHPKAEKKQISIETQWEETDIPAVYDGKWTEEAFFNILDNGVKYSPAGGKVKVSVKKYELYTAISVQDQGPGIREEDLPKIFGRFYRSETVQQEEGVGLGLYLAREILKKENGYIKVRSVPGRGAEFIMYLPTDE